MTKHASDSSAQMACEHHIRKAVESRIGASLDGTIPPVLSDIQLDGFDDGGEPKLVEIWAHQGKAKLAQKNKLMADAAKMLFCESLLGRKCKKIIAVSDLVAVSHLGARSWQRRLLDSFGFEIMVLPIPDDVRTSVIKAQRRQCR